MALLRTFFMLVFICSASSLRRWNQSFIRTVHALLLDVNSRFPREKDDEREMLCSEIICDDYECPETEECLYGTVPDVCQCCFTCAKGPGEQCGGMFDLAGICMKGYYCEPHPKYPQLPGVCYEK